MLSIYRITLKKWSKQLVASGRSARWNRKGEFVLYAAESSCLACLENVVHRNGEGLHADFALIEINVPIGIRMTNVLKRELPEQWKSFDNYFACQKIGSAWYAAGQTALLRVPSVIIPGGYNYLINTKHKDFEKIQLESIQPFLFDERIKH